jgi:phosphoribosylamine--glycine ligase
VAASEGYPGAYKKGDEIRGLDACEEVPEVVVFHGGTRTQPTLDRQIVTDGGRVLCVTALGENLDEARARAYAGYDCIQWEGKFCRRDIGVRHERRRATPPDAGAEAQPRRTPSTRPGGTR